MAYIGINQRIPISIIEMALSSAINGTYSTEYAVELASTEFDGENRQKKAALIIKRLTLDNLLFEYIKENKDLVFSALKYKDDRATIMSALISSAYPIGYDVLETMGKYFHVQDVLRTETIVNRMSAKYGSNRSLPNALYSVLPMFIEAGLINRPQAGEYSMNRLSPITEIANELYKRAFFVNNPNLSQDIIPEDHPYFEYFS